MISSLSLLSSKQHHQDRDKFQQTLKVNSKKLQVASWDKGQRSLKEHYQRRWALTEDIYILIIKYLLKLWSNIHVQAHKHDIPLPGMQGRHEHDA